MAGRAWSWLQSPPGVSLCTQWHTLSIWDVTQAVNYFLKGYIVGIVFSWERVCCLSRGDPHRKGDSGEVGKWYISREEVSECKALEPYLYKELMLSPGNSVRHRPWMPFSREVIKKWGTSCSDDSILSSLLTMSFCCRL